MNTNDLTKVKGPVAGHNITEMESASMTDAELAQVGAYTDSLAQAGLTAENSVENIFFIDADYTHGIREVLAIDTTAGPVTVTIPADNVNNLIISDAKGKFNSNPVTVIFDDNATSPAILLDVKNRSWNIFETGGAWFAQIVGRGEITQFI